MKVTEVRLNGSWTLPMPWTRVDRSERGAWARRHGGEAARSEAGQGGQAGTGDRSSGIPLSVPGVNVGATSQGGRLLRRCNESRGEGLGCVTWMSCQCWCEGTEQGRRREA